MADSAMTPERWRQIEEILDRTFELPPGERSEVLEQACAGDPDLRSHVEALLAADRSDGILESPAHEAAETLLRAATPPDEPLAGRDLGPYRVVRRIGAGGMGEIFEARDTRLDRRVALKLLPPAWGRDPAAKTRFLREARAVSAFDHPNICTLYDIGETEGGRMYLVMAYYDGETLEQKLERGPLDVDEALDLAVQVARGLERAHQEGVTHRDVKPANLMIAEGDGGAERVKILDFGIAKVAGDAGLTRTGTSPGTPAYMSPEQASGGLVDHRTDVWSLGVLLYEMVAGRHPFTADNATDMAWAILHREPEPLERRREGVPATLRRILSRALAKDLGERYPTMAHLRADLEAAAGLTPSGRPITDPRRPGGRRRSRQRWAAGLAVMLAALATGGIYRWTRTTPDVPATVVAAPDAVRTAEAPSVDVPVVGVVPFTNRTGDDALDWYGEGIARLVADGLSTSRHLRVISTSRTEPLAAIESSAEMARLAGEDDIEVLLTGEILPAPDGLTLSARLTEVSGGRQLAARSFEASEPGQLLQSASDIVREARRGLNVPTSESVAFFAADFAAENLEAYDSFVAGLRAFAQFRYPEAEAAFRETLANAPGFTMARYRLAQVEHAVSRNVEAREDIRRAAAEADRLPDREARYVRAAEAYITGRYDQAAAAYRELIERYPYETDARTQLALALKSARRHEEQLAVLEELKRLEPNNPRAWSLSGDVHLALGNLSRAVADIRRYAELDPSSAYARFKLGTAYRARGELELAAAEYSRSRELDPGYHWATAALAVVDVLKGEPGLAEGPLTALARDQEMMPRLRIESAFHLAAIYRSQGRFLDAAQALAERSPIIEAERVREAWALSVRGASLMESGDFKTARRLIDLAVQRSPTVPTRYLFERGLLELRERRLDDLERTAGEILNDAPGETTDRKVEKAAAYLRGMAALAAGRPDEAIDELSSAVALDGYEYRVYRLGLARAYLAAKRHPEAMTAARQASTRRDSVDPRLDLGLDRARALLVLAQVEVEIGRPAEGAAHARRFLELWSNADAGLADVDQARRLAAID